MMSKCKVAIAFSLLATFGVVTSVSYEQYFSKTYPIAHAQEAQHLIHLEPHEAHDLIQAQRDNPDFVILDVRTPAEFAEGHLENAININFYAHTFEQDMSQLDRDKTYLVYCRRGVRRDRTLRLMQALGFERVYNLLGGTVRWQQAGFSTVL